MQDGDNVLALLVTLGERLHRGGESGTGCGCWGRRRLRSSIRQLVWRERSDLVCTGHVQAAEDVQALGLTPVEVQTEDGGEDKQHRD